MWRPTRTAMPPTMSHLGVPGTPATIAYTATATDPAGNTSEFSAAFRTKLLNISTRMQVLTGDGVPIGGFVVTGLSPKKVLLRGIGPSLAPFGVPGALADPTLELHAADGSVINSNDNWKDTQAAEIEATGLMPTNDLESAIVESLRIPAPTPRFWGETTTPLASVWSKPTTLISRLIRNWPISAPAVLSTLGIT